MVDPHAHVKPHPHWPEGVSAKCTIPETSLVYNAEVSARRYPGKPFIVFYDREITYAEFLDHTERIAGWLQAVAGVKAGDRVLLFMHNSPQFVLGYYGILRANAVVVPVNPMNLTEELRHYVTDAGAPTILAPQTLYPVIRPLMGPGEPGGGRIHHALIGAYSDYLPAQTDLVVPDFVRAPRTPIAEAGVTLWADMLEARWRPGPATAGPDDLCVMPYTSGTTGHPKGCMHTHRNVMSTLVAQAAWLRSGHDDVLLSVLPLFHVTGMQGSMNMPLYVGSTIVVMPRWDRDVAARLIERYGVTAWQAISTMMVDFLANPKLGDYQLGSIRRLSGGGAAMPEAVAQRLAGMGLTYLEGYGMSETIAPTHINPPHRPKAQCLGIPIFDVDARIVDPNTLAPVTPGEVGEILVSGPQVMQGYWGKPDATAAVFVTIDGKRFLRTGDLARQDEDGYFFMVDRLKRMINAAGFKVWPAEVEALMYQCPHVQEACVIAARDERRGETVKAVVVLEPASRGTVTEQDVIDWCHAHMAAYKSPRLVQFVEALPKSATGKVMWRALQDAEDRAA